MNSVVHFALPLCVAAFALPLLRCRFASAAADNHAVDVAVDGAVDVCIIAILLS